MQNRILLLTLFTLFSGCTSYQVQDTVCNSLNAHQTMVDNAGAISNNPTEGFDCQKYLSDKQEK